jgi:stearoyl-CoA 9-desaturase NADPH oxidoreductase
VMAGRGGRVSGFLHDRVRPGHLLRLSPAAGAFVLPDAPGGKLLFLTAGSGITPVMSMLRDREARGATEDFVLVHHARSRGDVIFLGELEALAARHGLSRAVLGLSDGGPGPGRFDEERFRRLVPDFADRETFLCGPPAFMARAERLWAGAAASGRLHRERFTLAVAAAPAAGGPVRIVLTRSRRSFTVMAGRGSPGDEERE